jgi:hypothetical protein
MDQRAAWERLARCNGATVGGELEAQAGASLAYGKSYVIIAHACPFHLSRLTTCTGLEVELEINWARWQRE